MKRVPPKRLGSLHDRDDVVHVCFAWYSESLNREFWSTVCLDHDSIDAFNVDDYDYEKPTCIRCIVGISIRWDS